MKKFLPVLFFVVACAVFFYPTITKGLLPVPTDTLIGLYHPWLDQAAVTNPAGVPFKNFLITDPIRQQIPWRKLVIDEIKKGKMPSWNAYNFSGAPLLSNIQAAVWYPLNVLFLLAPFSIAWTLLVALQPLLASTLLYVYLRSKNISPGVAVFAGIVWAFCGFSIAWLTWGTIVQTALWLPVMLLATDKLILKGSIRWGLLFACASAFALFAGHVQVALYVFVFAGLYALFGLWNAHNRKNAWWIIGAAAVAVVVSSLQWVPFLQALPLSSRLADASGWMKDGWFLPWQHLVQFIAPDFFGNPATLNYWGIWNYGEFIGYIGILPLILAFFAIIERRDRFTRFIGVLGGMTLLFLLPTPLARLPYEAAVPVLSSLQPTRLMVILDFCLVLLAALGLDAYLRKPNKKIIFGISLTGVILAALWIYVLRTPTADIAVSKRNLILPSALWAVSGAALLLWVFLKRKWSTLFVFLVVGVTIFDLFRFGWKFTPFTPQDYFFPQTRAISFLTSQQKPFRVMSLDNRIVPPNVGAYYGIESIEGYDPIYSARYEEYIAALNRREANIKPPFGFNRIITVPTIDSPLVKLLNVKYVLTLEEIKSSDLELMYREGNTRIYYYKKALPRIYPVESVVTETTKQGIMDALYDRKFNPLKTAVVEGALVIAPHPLTDADSVRITSYTDSTLTAAASLTNDHFVVIANMYDPHWRVTVDGSPVKIQRADYIFFGIVVPKGDHLIKLVYF